MMNRLFIVALLAIFALMPCIALSLCKANLSYTDYKNKIETYEKAKVWCMTALQNYDLPISEWASHCKIRNYKQGEEKWFDASFWYRFKSYESKYSAGLFYQIEDDFVYRVNRDFVVKFNVEFLEGCK